MEKIKILLKTILIAVLGVMIFASFKGYVESWLNGGKYSTTNGGNNAIYSTNTGKLTTKYLGTVLETDPWILQNAVASDFLGSYIRSNTVNNETDAVSDLQSYTTLCMAHWEGNTLTVSTKKANLKIFRQYLSFYLDEDNGEYTFSNYYLQSSGTSPGHNSDKTRIKYK